MSFVFSVVEVGEKKLAGIKVETSMEKAARDCPDLWHTFGPRCEAELAEIANLEGGAYGISVMTGNEGSFTYWAAVEVFPDASLPEGMAFTTIPAGLYVRCTVPGLEQLGSAFEAMYGEWPRSQGKYAISHDPQGVCFELYPLQPKPWDVTDPLEIYGPVVKKG